MRTADIDAMDPLDDGRDRERRGLTDALGTTDVALSHYRLAPGERLSGLHGHGDQEEVFVVLAGAVTFEVYDGGMDAAGGHAETHDGEAGQEVAVAEGEAVRFAPGEYQSGRNDGDGPATVLALGAPRDSEDVRIPLACPDCGHGHVEPTLDDAGDPVLACPECGAESAVECPDCGSEDMHAVLAEDGSPVSSCRDCGYASRAL